MDLSTLDIRILRFCLEHGVLDSEREIARKLRISPSTLSFKLRKFEDKGIITTYKYRVDYSKIGLGQLAWVFLKIRPGNATIKGLMDKLLEYPEVHVCLYVSGEHAICLKAYGASKAGIEKFVQKIGKEISSAIASHKTFFVSKALKAHNQKIEGNGIINGIGETDLKILSEKMLNPKIGITELAKKLGIHRNTASARWGKMLEHKIVVKKTPIINPELHRQIGIHFMALNLFKAGKHGAGKLAGALLEMNEVHELGELEPKSGNDLLAVIRTNDIDSYYKITASFFSDKRFAPHIQEYDSFIIIASDSRRHTYLKDLGLQNLVK